MPQCEGRSFSLAVDVNLSLDATASCEEEGGSGGFVTVVAKGDRLLRLSLHAVITALTAITGAISQQKGQHRETGKQDDNASERRRRKGEAGVTRCPFPARQ